MNTTTHNGNGKRNGKYQAPWDRVHGQLETPATFDELSANYKDKVANRFKGADLDRFTRDLAGVHTLGSSGDRHYREEIRFYRMIEIARDIERNDMTAGHGLDRLVANLLQEGFKYDPTTGDEETDVYLKEKWGYYAKDPIQVDLQQERNFDQLTWAIVRAMFSDGDQLVNPLASGQFQTIEAHLLRTPWGKLSGDERRMTIHGVELDDSRRRVRYHIAQDDIPMWETVKYQNQDYSQIAAYDSEGFPNVFLVKHNFRRTGSQTRGVSIYSPIVHAIGMLDDVQFAKLVQQQGVSVWIAEIMRSLEGEYPEEEQSASGYDMADLCRPGEMKTIEDLSAGMIYKGLPGEKLNGFSPNVPNPTYFDHAKQITEVIGVNEYLPYIVLMMDATATNFSGWRGAMDQAKIVWRVLQNNIACDWHRPACDFKVRQWIEPGTEHFDPFLLRKAASGINVFSHRWQFPSWPYVNPLEDVTANSMEVRQLQNSPRRVQARQGRDYLDVIVGELLDDNYALIDRAMQLADQLNSSHPDQSVTWERLISVGGPDNVSVSLSKSIDDPAQQESQVLANQPSQQPNG